MQFEKKIGVNNKVLTISLPADLAVYLKLEAGTLVIMQDEIGKHGPYISIWKKDRGEK